MSDFFFHKRSFLGSLLDVRGSDIFFGTENFVGTETGFRLGSPSQMRGRRMDK